MDTYIEHHSVDAPARAVKPVVRWLSRWNRTLQRQGKTIRIAIGMIGLLAAMLLSNPVYAEGGPGGSFQTDVLIEAPAYHGLEPKLRLTYSGGDGNGWFGVGWKLSGLSFIERVSPQRGSPLWDSSDGFMLDGQALIPCTTSMTSPSCQNPVAGMAMYALVWCEKSVHNASPPKEFSPHSSVWINCEVKDNILF